MPDDIEKTIYRFEIDDSAYTAGIDRLSASTRKLAQTQEAANQELTKIETKIKNIGKTPITIPTIKIPATATAELNKLAATIETLRAKILARKDFLLTETDINKIRTYNKEIQTMERELQRLQNIGKAGFNEMGDAIGKTAGKTNVLTKSFGFFRQAAYLIPGIGLAGIFNVMFEAISKSVTALFAAGEAASDYSKRQKIIKDINEKAIESFVQQTTHLELIRKKLTDLSTPEGERVKLLKEYNSIADKGNQIDKTQIDNLDLINSKITAQIDLIKKRALARAAENIIAEKAEALLKAQFELETKSGIKLNDKLLAQLQKGGGEALLKGLSANDDILGLLDAAKKLLNAKKDFQRSLDEGLPFIDAEGLTTKPGQNDKNVKTIENVFAQKLAELQSRLASVIEKSFQSEGSIKGKFAAELNKQFEEIAKLLKEKKLTAPQADILNGLLSQINSLELSKSLKEFKEKQKEAMRQIDDALLQASIDSANKQVANIRDEFDREKEAIEQGYLTTTATIEKTQKALLKKIDDEQSKGLISEGDAKRQKFLASVLFGNLLSEAGVAKTNAELDLAFKIFKKTLDAAKTPFEDQLLTLSQETTEEIRVQTARFFEGKIGYEKYQKELTEIIQKETRRRKKIALDEATEQLRLVKLQLLNTDLTKSQKESLEDQVRSLENQIASLNREILTGGATDQGNVAKKKLDNFLAYVNAISDLANAVLSFWQKTNEAEQEALDKSIALQEKRVEAAQRIAARGNAQYLKEEEDRLTQLQIKRENAARKQLGIDAALQASQVLVGITGAISKIASSPFGAETIAEIAIIISALATGYGIVKNLQGNQPHLAEGTKYLSRGKNPAGRDTIPAMLDEGEAVIPADKNKAYHPTIAALYDGTIPADHMNQFVKTYHKIKRAPQTNYAHIGEVANMQISADGKMAILLSENNKKLDEHISLQKQTLHAMKHMSVDAKIDRDGVAIAVNEYMQQMERDKKS